MSYYKEKIKANKMIDDLFKKGEPTAMIYYKLDTIYGFTKNFVDKRIKLIEMAAAIQRTKNARVED